MRRINIYLVVTIVATFFISLFFINKNYNGVDNVNNNKIITNESRGIFISYLEYQKYFQNKNNDNIKKEINNIIQNIKDNNINTIYLHVRPFSDSIYNSKIFPFSHTISGKQGKGIDLDVLNIFLEKAHESKIKIHAWINPYRISNNTDIEFLSINNPAYKYLNTNHVKVIPNKGIYYNPASKVVKKLIIDGIKEIVSNYKVDGILLDDYFYPDDTIDLENYEEVKNTISLTDFRLSNVNELISEIYKTIKEINSEVEFGISPDGNIDNNYNIHYSDIKKWLKEDNYIDYIMPQIYYGFLHETKPFIKTLNEWNELIINNVKLISSLALYKVNSIDEYALSGKDEWLENDEIIKKQIKICKTMSSYYGYALFRYDYLKNY